ncbi:Lipoyltransferase and lipoate-protein ligase [Ceratobasidium sp. AG-I]|nr:Lipoyltransferase and lipoate-protein ligase [Ceratobasidium sp. AG-I]
MVLAPFANRFLQATRISPLYQRYSTARPQSNIFVSLSNDPYFNLSYEDWLFRHTDPSLPVLFMYRNKESVIIGRNQNPWKEINQTALRQSNIEFVRRKSGGGTVYHDLGNTNYSVMIPRETFDRNTNAELVASALNSPEISILASVNERHDIVVQGKKVSGSAYKIISKRAYHHGTMLIDAQLDRLGNLLRNTKASLHTKGVESVRSPVANLVSFSPRITHETFVNAVARVFREKYDSEGNNGNNIVHVEHGNEIVEKGVEELRSWDWRFGQTPEFTHDLSKTFPWGEVKVHITSKRGLIADFEVSGINISKTDLIGLHYETLDGAEDILTKSYTGHQIHLQNFLSWLRLEM